MSGKSRINTIDEDSELYSYCIVLRDLHGPKDQPIKFLVEVNDINILNDVDNNSSIFEKFVEEARAYFASNPIDSSENYDIYIGFWGQWYCEIPANFFAFVLETGLKVSLDIDD